MRVAAALIVLVSQIAAPVAAAPCVRCVRQVRSFAVQSYAAPVVKQPYIAYQPVQYAVAPWVQAQAQDTYHFRGSEERFELERLRGYVAAVQQLTSQSLEEEQPEPQPGFEEQPAQPQGTWNQPQGQQLPAPPPSRALVQLHCAKCHGGAEPAGAFYLDASTPITDEIRGAVVRVLRGDHMPLGPDRKTPVPLDAQTKFDLLMELGDESEPGV